MPGLDVWLWYKQQHVGHRDRRPRQNSATTPPSPLFLPSPFSLPLLSIHKPIFAPTWLLTLNQIQLVGLIKMAKTTTLREFESIFPKLVEDILEFTKKYNLPEDFVDWYKRVRIVSALRIRTG